MNWKQIKKQTRGENLDSLTGVLKKNVAEERIASIVNTEHTGTLFLCDVNRLQRINNQYGHLAGDECLKQVAQILDYMTHRDDILGRYGGDEFIIFVPSCRREEQAQEIVSQARTGAVGIPRLIQTVMNDRSFHGEVNTGV